MTLRPSAYIVGSTVQASIPPFPVLVQEKVFYNDSPDFEEWVPCSAFGLSSYQGHALTFQVLTSQGAVFSYVPFHLMRHALTPHPAYDLQDLVYARCPDEQIAVTRYSALSDVPCQAFLKGPEVWLNATYVTTVDWYRLRDLAHILALENGQFALLPSHKVLFGVGEDQRTLPSYKKLRSEWKVEGPPRFEKP